MGFRIIVFANCQANPLASTLGVMSSELEIIRCPPVHTIRADNTQSVFEMLSQADVIVHQPIGEGFGPISSDAIKERFPNKLYLSFPSVYYAGTFPQLGYLRLPQGGGTLSGPLNDYHDMRILRNFLAGVSIEACVRQLEWDFSSYNDLTDKAKQESLRRDVGVDVPIMKWVEEALKERACFYTFNHPDNGIIWKIAEHLLGLLDLTVSPHARLRQKPFLGEISASIPLGVCETLAVSWRRELYSINGNEISWRDLVSQFYASYKSVNELREIVDFNRKRSSIPLLK